MTDTGALAAKIAEARETDLHQSFSYHSWVSVEHKYVCMTVPKVACSTIKLLLNQLGGKPDPEDLGDIHDRGLHLSDFTVDENVEMLTSPEWFRFAFVRNPYDRLLSAYKSKVGIWGDEYGWLQEEIKTAYDYPIHPQGWKAIPAFRDFVRYLISHWDRVGGDGHFNLQSNILAHDLINYDSLKWFFYFVDEFQGILQRFNAPQEITRRVSVRRNVTLPVHHPLAYDRELADSVYELYRQDFEQYGFEKNSWLYDSDAPHTNSYLSGVIEELSEHPVE